jgi:hypothetical protein
MALSSKDPQETVIVTFDFTALATAISNPSVASTCIAGTLDANPAAILQGAPIVSSTRVMQQVTGGLDGATYDLRCQATAQDGSVYVLSGWLAVQSV